MAKWFGSIILIVALVLVTSAVAIGQQEPETVSKSVYLPLVRVGSTGPQSQCTSPGDGWVRESLKDSCGWHLSDGLFVLQGGNSAVLLQLVADVSARGPFDGQTVYEAPATIWIEDLTAPAVIAVPVWIDPMPTPFPCVAPGEGWTQDPLPGSCGWHLQTGVRVVLSGGDIFSWVDVGQAAHFGPFVNEEFTGPVTLWYEREATKLVTSTIVKITPTPVVTCEELRPSSGWTRDPLQGSCGWHLETGKSVSLEGGDSKVLLVKSATVSIRGPFDELEVTGPTTLWYENMMSPKVISTALIGPPDPPATPTSASTPTPTQTPTSQPTATSTSTSVPPTATATAVPTVVPCQVPQGTPGEWDRIVDSEGQPYGCGWQLRLNSEELTITVPQGWKVVTELGEELGPVEVTVPAFRGASLWRL